MWIVSTVRTLGYMTMDTMLNIDLIETYMYCVYTYCKRNIPIYEDMCNCKNVFRYPPIRIKNTCAVRPNPPHDKE